MMKHLRAILLLTLMIFCLTLMTQAAPGESTSMHTSKGSYTSGSKVTLEGMLTITQANKTSPHVAILTLYETTSFLNVPLMAGGTKDFVNVKDIQVMVPNKNNKKSVRVTGTLAGRTDAIQHQREYILKDATMEVIPAVTKVKISKTKLSVPIGKTATLQASVSPARALKRFTWSSSKPSVATVSASGVVTAVAKGTATITAKSLNGKKATCKVTVTIPATGVALNQTSVTVQKGKSFTIKATVSPTNATTKAVTWSSSDKKIATVDKKGKVKAVKAGSAIITAKTKDGGFTASCAVSVTAPPVNVTSVALNTKNVTLGRGATSQLTATVKPSNATVRTITWTTSNNKVATVDASGKVQGVGGGTATITATAHNGKKATCAVTVVIPVESVALKQSDMTIAIGSTSTLQAVVSPADATTKTLTWSSTDANVARVDKNGKVTGVSYGWVAIIATSNNGKVGSCWVSVVDAGQQDDTLVTISIIEINRILAPGNTVQLTAVPYPANAKLGTVTWRSSNPSVATVSSSGLVTCKAVGVFEIRASVGNLNVAYPICASGSYAVVSPSLGKPGTPIGASDLCIVTPKGKVNLPISYGEIKKLYPGGSTDNASNGYYDYHTDYASYSYGPNDSFLYCIVSKYNPLYGSAQTNRGISVKSSFQDVIAKYGRPDGILSYGEWAYNADGIANHFREETALIYDVTSKGAGIWFTISGETQKVTGWSIEDDYMNSKSSLLRKMIHRQG